MSRTKIDRRKFITGLGAAGVTLPFLPSLFDKATAAAVTPPKRLVFIMNRNGQFHQNFFPDTAGMTLFQPNVAYKTLSSISGPMSNLLGTGYDPYRNKMAVIRGLDLINMGGHCRTSFLCASSPQGAIEGGLPNVGASIDWVISNAAAFYPTVPVDRMLRMSINPGRGFSFLKSAAGPTDLPYLGTDQSAYNSIFSSFTSGRPAIDVGARKVLITDKISDRLSQVLKHPRLGAADRQRLQTHLDVLAQLRTIFGSSTRKPITCAPPAISYYDYYAGDQRRKIYKNFNDIIVAAFSCDITRMACVYIEDFDDVNQDYSYFHGLSHNPMSDDPSAALSKPPNAWISDRVLDLIQKMDSIVEADGSTMLDNSLVVWGNEFSYGDHSPFDLPLMTAGSLQNTVRTNVYVDYRQTPYQIYAGRGDIFGPFGQPYSQFLCTIMKAAGVTPAELAPALGPDGYFGEWAPGFYYGGQWDAYKANRNKTLPYYSMV